MYLQLYGLGALKEAAVPWHDLVAGFSPYAVVPEPDKEGTHWVLEHPTRPIRFYAPVISGAITRVHVEYDDVFVVGGDPDRAQHPIWSALFRALSTQPVLLVVQPPGMGTPMAKAVVVSDAAHRGRFPSWVDDRELVFVTPSRAAFDRLIEEAWDISTAFVASSQPRTGWADEQERDDTALREFAGWVGGKRGRRPTYRWGDQTVKPEGSSGSFLDRYGTLVDWRDFDDSIVRYFGDLLRGPRLTVEIGEDALLIRFDATSKRLSYDEIGTERYQTIRAVNEVLAPHFEIRLVRRSVDGDTHCFLLAPAWLWAELEATDRDRLERKVRRIDPRDGFS